MSPEYVPWLIASAVVFSALSLILLRSLRSRATALVCYVVIVLHGLFCDNLPAVALAAVVAGLVPAIFKAVSSA